MQQSSAIEAEYLILHNEFTQACECKTYEILTYEKLC